MGIIRLCGTPIKERGISWVESYSDKSAYLKEQFEDQVGPGSYFRWEGHDKSTDTDYYVVVTPGFSKKHGYHFFAGLRKEPATNGSSGKNFTTQGEALSYAIEHWNVPRPEGMQHRPYVIKDIEDKEIIKENVHASFDTKEDNIRLSGKGKMIILDMTEDVITKEAMATTNQWLYLLSKGELAVHKRIKVLEDERKRGTIDRDGLAELKYLKKQSRQTVSNGVGDELHGEMLRTAFMYALIMDPHWAWMSSAKHLHIHDVMNWSGKWIYDRNIQNPTDEQIKSQKEKPTYRISTCRTANESIFNDNYVAQKTKLEKLFDIEGKKVNFIDLHDLEKYGTEQEQLDNIKVIERRIEKLKKQEESGNEELYGSMNGIKKEREEKEREVNEFYKFKVLSGRVQRHSISEVNPNKMISLSLKVRENKEKDKKGQNKKIFLSKWPLVKSKTVSDIINGQPIQKHIIVLEPQPDIDDPEPVYDLMIPLELYPYMIDELSSCTNIEQTLIIKDQTQRDSARVYNLKVGAIEREIKTKTENGEDVEKEKKALEIEKEKILNQKIFQTVGNISGGENIVFEPGTLKPLGINTEINKSRGKESLDGRKEESIDKVPYVFKESQVNQWLGMFETADDLRYALVSGQIKVTNDMLIDSRTCALECGNPYKKAPRLTPTGKPLTGEPLTGEGDVTEYDQVKVTGDYQKELDHLDRITFFNSDENRLEIIDRHEFEKENGPIENLQTFNGIGKVIVNTITFLLSDKDDENYPGRKALYEVFNGDWECFDTENKNKIVIGKMSRYSVDTGKNALDAYKVSVVDLGTYSDVRNGYPTIQEGCDPIETTDPKTGKKILSVIKTDKSTGEKREVGSFELLDVKERTKDGSIKIKKMYRTLILRQYSPSPYSTGKKNIGDETTDAKNKKDRLLTMRDRNEEGASVETDKTKLGEVVGLGPYGPGYAFADGLVSILKDHPDVDREMIGPVINVTPEMRRFLKAYVSSLWEQCEAMVSSGKSFKTLDYNEKRKFTPIEQLHLQSMEDQYLKIMAKFKKPLSAMKPNDKQKIIDQILNQYAVPVDFYKSLSEGNPSKDNIFSRDTAYILYDSNDKVIDVFKKYEYDKAENKRLSTPGSKLEIKAESLIYHKYDANKERIREFSPLQDAIIANNNEETLEVVSQKAQEDNGIIITDPIRSDKTETPVVIENTEVPDSISTEPDLTNEAEAIEYMRAASDTDAENGDWARREAKIYDINDGYTSWFIDKIRDPDSDEQKEGTVYWELLNKKTSTPNIPSMPQLEQDNTKAPTSIKIDPIKNTSQSPVSKPKRCKALNDIGDVCNSVLDENGKCNNPNCSTNTSVVTNAPAMQNTALPSFSRAHNSIETLIKTANKLDEEGKFQEAAAIDRFIKILAAKKDSEE